MSVLTKIFVVALVVLSLLLSAATITFVNSIDDYKGTIDRQGRQVANLETQLNTARAETQKQATDLADQVRSLEAAIAERDTTIRNLNTRVAEIGANLARANSAQTIAEANLNKLTSAVNAAQETVTRYSQQIADLRTDNDRLQTQNGELNVAFNDATNKLNITEEVRRNTAEQLAELRTQLDRVSGALRDRGVDPNRITSSGVAAGAPAINGVIRRTSSIGNIPHAAISIGSEDAVKVGMEFNILDRSSGKFLGKLTVVAVEPNEAVGRLTGPNPAAIQAGAEVRTQL